MANQPATIYEVVVRLEGFGFPLVTHIEQTEYEKFIAALGNGGDHDGDFYGFHAADGLKSYVNLDAVLAIHVPNYVGTSEDGAGAKAVAASDAQDGTVLLRVWSSLLREPELYGDITREEWMEIQRALDGDFDPFIGFTDETGERLMLPRRRVLAVEACDSSANGNAQYFRDFYHERARETAPVEVAIE